MESRIIYFEKQGKQNTDEVLAIAKKRADELGINTILVSSTWGYTGLKAVDYFQGMKLVIVTEATGNYTPDVQEMSAENQEIIRSKGGIVLTTSHAFAGIDRAMRTKFGMYLLADVISQTLRLFGEGIKVCCEIALMAADSGLVSTNENAISIAGSHKGADAAVVLRPVNTQNFFNMQVKEILCKPLVSVGTVQAAQKSG
ncbi:pyruvate kinase alpha/beta domain-containing protein [Chloroflexota bacterium]